MTPEDERAFMICDLAYKTNAIETLEKTLESYKSAIQDFLDKVDKCDPNLYDSVKVFKDLLNPNPQDEVSEIFGGLRELIKDDEVYQFYIDQIEAYANSKIK